MPSELVMVGGQQAAIDCMHTVYTIATDLSGKKHGLSVTFTNRSPTYY